MRACTLLTLAIVATAAAGDVSVLLEPIRARHHLPALAAASFAGGTALDSGVCGVRKAGGTERATLGDRWHLASCTKSMTASLVAILVERGVLRWDSTVGDLLPDMGGMKPAWQKVTLELLLGHRAGAPHDAPPQLWAEARKKRGTPTEQRADFVRGLLHSDPNPAPGNQFNYSNQGYSIVGAMLEQKTGKPWEHLMREMLFTPLGLNSSGFGAPGAPGGTDQPWGHRVEGFVLTPMPPGSSADNPPAVGPGGIVHMSIGDFARYAAWHVDEARRDQRLLQRASFQKLHTALAGQDYALGWVTAERPWGGGRVLTHSGTNTMNFAVMWVAPERDFAVVAATNAGGAEAEKGCDRAVSALIQKWEAARR